MNVDATHVAAASATTANSGFKQVRDNISERRFSNTKRDTEIDQELNSMISQFVSPISDKICMDYDPGLRRHHNTPVDNKQLETPLEHG